MGQRINYILKENSTTKIYYHHWRANTVISDLYLGAEKFIEFVRTCKEVDDLINEPWIEGCVYIDLNRKLLAFWSLEFPRITSLEHYYFSKLSKKWKDWDFKLLKRRMYDIEELIGYDYIQHQTFDFTNASIEEIKDDKVTDWVQTLVIFKEIDDLFVTKTGCINIEGIISIGKESIPLLKEKPSYKLEDQNELQIEIFIIDILERKIYSNDSNLGLWEHYHHLWEGYSFQMGDLGLIEILNLANIKTSKNIRLSEEKIVNEFNNLIKISNDFDPKVLAEDLVNELGNDLEFNPNFFDNTKPKSEISFIQKIKNLFS